MVVADKQRDAFTTRLTTRSRIMPTWYLRSRRSPLVGFPQTPPYATTLCRLQNFRLAISPSKSEIHQKYACSSSSSSLLSSSSLSHTSDAGSHVTFPTIPLNSSMSR